MDALDVVRLRLGRAVEHLAALRKAILDYSGDRPYMPVIENEANLHYVAANWDALTEEKRRSWRNAALPIIASEVRPLPDAVPLIIGDLLHNLRSSLDHLSWHLVIARSTKPPVDAKRQRTLRAQNIQARLTGFPILDQPRQHKSGRPVELLSPFTDATVEAELDRLQPYHAANPIGPKLALIRDLNNTEKHSTLREALILISAGRVTVTFPSGHAQSVAWMASTE